MLHNTTFWLAIGFLGQALFSMRFLIQWLASEAQKKSVIPHAFWWFSIAGGVTLFAYALWRLDPVFIAGQGVGLLIYARNLHLISRANAQARQPSHAPNHAPSHAHEPKAVSFGMALPKDRIA